MWQEQKGAGCQEEERRFYRAWSLAGLIKPSPAALSQGAPRTIPSVVLVWLLWAVLPWGLGALGVLSRLSWCPAQVRERQKAGGDGENHPWLCWGTLFEQSQSDGASQGLLEMPGKRQKPVYAGEPNFSGVLCLKTKQLCNLDCGKALFFQN